MCQKTSISVYGNLCVFLMFCPPGGRDSGRLGVGGLGGRSPPMETPPEQFWEFVWVPLQAWAEIRSSPKIPLSICPTKYISICNSGRFDFICLDLGIGLASAAVFCQNVYLGSLAAHALCSRPSRR